MNTIAEQAPRGVYQWVQSQSTSNGIIIASNIDPSALPTGTQELPQSLNHNYMISRYLHEEAMDQQSLPLPPLEQHQWEARPAQPRFQDPLRPTQVVTATPQQQGNGPLGLAGQESSHSGKESSRYPGNQGNYHHYHCDQDDYDWRLPRNKEHGQNPKMTPFDGNVQWQTVQLGGNRSLTSLLKLSRTRL